MTNENQTAGKKQRKLGLTSVILIALALGIVCGVIFHYIILREPCVTTFS